MNPVLNPKNRIPSRCLRIYIPSKDSRTHKFENGRMVKDLCAVLLSLFRGCTKYKAEGIWKSEDGKIIGEEVTIVESYGSGKKFKKAAEEIIPMLQKFKSQYKQESMAVLIDKNFRLI